MSVGILSKNILVWDVIYISIGNFRCSIMKVCGNFCMSMASADKCFLIQPRITRSISSNERLSFRLFASHYTKIDAFPRTSKSMPVGPAVGVP